MINVFLQWTPSPSEGVDEQRVSIVNVDDLEIYGAAVLAPDADTFTALCPEGATVRGVVTTVRGEQKASVQSAEIVVPYGQLVPASNVTIDAPQASQLPSKPS